MRALRLAMIALSVILATAACGGPDEATIAADEFCEELKYLLREKRLGRVKDAQLRHATLDTLESLAATSKRLGRQLGPSIKRECPTAWDETVSANLGDLGIAKAVQAAITTDIPETNKAGVQGSILFHNYGLDSTGHILESTGLYTISTSSGLLNKLDLTDKLKSVGFTPDYFGFRSESKFDLSSDKKYIVMMALRDSKSSLFTVNISTLELERLTIPPNKCSDSNPVWSPTGSMVLIEEICPGAEGGLREIVVIDIDSKKRIYIQRDRDFHIPAYGLEFSPDEKHIVGRIHGYVGGEHSTIYPDYIVVYNFDSMEWRRIKIKGSEALSQHSSSAEFSDAELYFNLDQHSISPNGLYMALHGKITAYRRTAAIPKNVFTPVLEIMIVVDIDSGSVVQKIFNPEAVFDPDGQAKSRFNGKPSWSPDSKFIAMHTEDPGIYAYIFDIDEMTVRSLSSEDRDLSSGIFTEGPTWSTDGNYLLVDVCIPNCYSADQKSSIHVVHVASGEHEAVSSELLGTLSGLHWIPENS